MFAEDTIYIVGNAKAQQNNPITHQFGQFFIGFVVDRKSGKIVNCDCSSTIGLTNQFIGSLLQGRSLQDNIDSIRQLLESRYFAASLKAILVAFKDAQKQYNQIVNNLPADDS